MGRRPSAGRFDRRCRFDKRETASAGEAAAGAVHGAGWTEIATRWGDLWFEGGRERVEAGRPQSMVAATLKVNADDETRSVDAACRVEIDGAIFAIRSVLERPRSGLIEMSLERGAAA